MHGAHLYFGLIKYDSIEYGVTHFNFNMTSFRGVTDTTFWTSGQVSLEFQSQCGSPAIG